MIEKMAQIDYDIKSVTFKKETKNSRYCQKVSWQLTLLILYNFWKFAENCEWEEIHIWFLLVFTQAFLAPLANKIIKGKTKIW